MVDHGRVTLSVVIPAYNEERRLASSLEALSGFLRQHPWDWEIRIVDDGSTDATADVVRRFLAVEPRVVLQHEPHRGKGGAVKAGLQAARGDYRFICDADMSMPVSELPRFLPPRLTGVDVAIASREGRTARRVGEPIRRHLLGRILNWAVRRLTPADVDDTQCGFKMFTAAAVNSIFPRVTIDGWAFDIEVLTIARAQRLTLVEIPIEWHYQQESQLSMMRDGTAMLRDLLRIAVRLRRGRYSG
jgi:dolichyl-phosphate beta-glucosyltransferase